MSARRFGLCHHPRLATGCNSPARGQSGTQTKGTTGSWYGGMSAVEEAEDFRKLRRTATCASRLATLLGPFICTTRFLKFAPLPSLHHSSHRSMHGSLHGSLHAHCTAHCTAHCAADCAMTALLVESCHLAKSNMLPETADSCCLLPPYPNPSSTYLCVASSVRPDVESASRPPIQARHMGGFDQTKSRPSWGECGQK